MEAVERQQRVGEPERERARECDPSDPLGRAHPARRARHIIGAMASAYSATGSASGPRPGAPGSGTSRPRRPRGSARSRRGACSSATNAATYVRCASEEERKAARGSSARSRSPATAEQQAGAHQPAQRALSIGQQPRSPGRQPATASPTVPASPAPVRRSRDKARPSPARPRSEAARRARQRGDAAALEAQQRRVRREQERRLRCPGVALSVSMLFMNW